MRQKISNIVQLTVEGADLTTFTNLEICIVQGSFEKIYTPTVVDATHMSISIPFADAMKLDKGTARLQFSYLNASGIPKASDVVSVEVKELIDSDGYNPTVGE